MFAVFVPEGLFGVVGLLTVVIGIVGTAGGLPVIFFRYSFTLAAGFFVSSICDVSFLLK